MNKYENRKEVPVKYQWDLTEFFESDKKWELEVNRVKKLLPKIKKYENNLSDPYKLEEYLNLDIDISNSILDLYVYAYLAHDVDLENSTYIEMKNKASSLSSEYELANSFAVPEILKLDEVSFNNLFKQNNNLSKYKVYLSDIYAEKKHILTPDEEKIISMLTETYSSYSNLSSILLDLEHNYGKIEIDNELITIATNNVRHLKKNNNPKIREEVSNKFNSVLKQYQVTASSLLNYYVKNNINLAKIRKYKSPWHKKLETLHLKQIIFDSLIEVSRNNADINKKYYSIAKKALKLPILHDYDLSLDWNESKEKYSIENAQKLIKEALSILGDDYLEKLDKVFDNRYIDYCQYKGKVSGGYSYATYRKNSRILLSYNENIEDIFTVIHEAGHNIHHQYVNDNNVEWYRHTPSIVAEVASLTNEILLSNYLYKNGKNKTEKLIGLENFIKTFKSNFFGAVMLGELELKMYDHVQKDNSITADFLNNEADILLSHYTGNSIEKSDYDKLMWVTRSHYFMEFYLFSYAICISVACIVAEKIINNEKGFVLKYKKFLSCGSNLKPMDIFKTLGIDITKKEIYEQAVKYFDSKLDLYEKLSENGD